MLATLIVDREAAAEMPEPYVVRENGKRIVKAGTTINHLMAFRLCQMGIAVPADEECRLATNRSDEQLKAAQHAAKRLDKGIHPDDFEAYDAGVMDGYNTDGSFKPGPNAAAETEDDEDYDEDEW